ncbi:MAG TPA: hypothetical protein VMG12_31490 [Polyangiaceae bacterium]|nr:hypothetical protein [Polyangiaceae bacterium]
MTRSSVAAAVVVTVLLAILIWWRDEGRRVQRSTEALSPPSGAAVTAGQVVAVPTERVVSPEAPPSTAPAPLAARRAFEPPQPTEAMRERRRRVLESPRARAPLAAPAAESSGNADAERRPMQDKTGKLGAEVKAINEQFLPLAEQCFDQAKERGVRGSGMLALQVKLAGAEGVGRIIESLEPAPDNAVPDAELIDCMRQSAFTVDLPPPSETGGSSFEMTMPFEGASADAGASAPPSAPR